MLITKGWFDELVPEETMNIAGIKSIRVPFVEHGICIDLSVATFPLLGPFAKGPQLIKFLKSDLG